ncbi:unnamed protein product [Rotaria magnacalcarata]|uniref:Uncharacterized protein n=1 Tax=Rotaria magnacalcarata TaxID=392030 RepID=A0A8S3ET92_9BILA|nr:unnamed protein product [Rotaria magnacalcarata]
MSERVNWTLKAQIAIYAERRPGLWDKKLQKLAFSIPHDLQVTYHFVREHSEIHNLSQKAAYDTHTINRQFQVGDLVWIQIPTPKIDNTTITHKLRPKFQGPCRLLEQLSPSTFIAMRISDHVNIGSTNIDRMKPYYEPPTTTSDETFTPEHYSAVPVRRSPLRMRRPTKTT